MIADAFDDRSHVIIRPCRKENAPKVGRLHPFGLPQAGRWSSLCERKNIDERCRLSGDSEQLPNTPEQLRAILEEIIAVQTENDFVTFEIKDVVPLAVVKKYAGIGASVLARIKNTKTPFGIDFGVGDVIVPEQKKRRIPRDTSHKEVSLEVFREFVGIIKYTRENYNEIIV